MERRDILKLSSAVLGYTLVGGTAVAVLSGCKADANAKPADLDLFDQSTYDMLVDITERIIPATDTPGAKDANVVSYIHSRMKNFMTEEERTPYMEGLKTFDVKSNEAYSKNYNDLTDEQKMELLTVLDKEAKGPGDHIFNTLKEETVVGFFTSEVGATKVLRFDPIPGRFDGCADYTAGQAAWAL